MNLLKTLQQTAKQDLLSDQQAADAALEAVKANIDLEDGMDRAMLSLFGTAKVVAENRNKIENVKQQLQRDVLTQLQIRTIALKYRLKCLPASQYVKEVPVRVLNDIRRYQEEKQISFRDTSYYQRHHLYILAPVSHFELGPRPNNDPIALHFDGREYRVISTWGNDFTAWQLFQAFAARHPALLFFLLFMSAVSGIMYLSGVAHWAWYLIPLVTASLVTAAINDGTENFDPFKATR